MNYRVAAETLRATSALRQIGVHQIIVVDNGPDKLKFPDTDIAVHRPDNPGYGAAVNIGARYATGEYLLILNPDIVIDRQALDHLLRELRDRPELALVGPRIVTDLQTDYSTGRRFPTLALVYGARLTRLLRASPPNIWNRYHCGISSGWAEPVDWISGACMLARRASLEALGGFDERFRLFFEDVDLCYRVRKLGGVAVIPNAAVHHSEGRSRATRPYWSSMHHHLSFWKWLRLQHKRGHLSRLTLYLDGILLLGSLPAAQIFTFIRRTLSR